jgi:biotin transporter BioY
VSQNENVPYIVYEAEMTRSERQIKRLWIALIIAITLIFASNVVWLMYINQYDFESYDLSTEDGGNANYIGQDGDIYNGTSES